MPAFQSELNVEALPASVQQQLAACIAGTRHPRPMWSVRRVSNDRWKRFLLPGLGLAVALIFASGGPTGWPWILAWLPAALALALCAAGWLHARRSARLFAFPDGTFLFATDLLEVCDGVCHRFDLDGVVNVRIHTPVPGAAAREVQFIFPDDTVHLAVPGSQAALHVLTTFNSARSTLAGAIAAQSWDEVAGLDPLYEARYLGAWSRYFRPVIDSSWKQAAGPPSGPDWLALPSAVWRHGAIAALLLAPALWFAGNFVLDEMAFRRAHSTNTVAAWGKYLKLAHGRQSREVRTRLLPASAFREVKAGGGVAALQNFLADYGNSPVAEEARAQLDVIYANAIDRSRKEASAQVRDGMAALLKYLQSHGSPKVQVRFGVTSQAMLAEWEEYLREDSVGRMAGEVAPIAASFSAENLRRREDAVFRLLQSGFASTGLGDAMLLERGLTFSGVPGGFEKPALAIQWTAKPVMRLQDTVNRQQYLSLAFDFQLSVVVPKSAPVRVDFAITPAEQIPAEFIGNSWYSGMIDLAFQEYQQHLATSFFPSQTTPRSIRLTNNPPRRAAPLPTAKTTRPPATATGFCISPLGYIVTAHHFTTGRKSFKVVTPKGKFDAELIREDAANDLAVLKFPGTLPTLAIRPASNSGRVGEKVATVGFPHPSIESYEPKYSEGTISRANASREQANMFQIAMDIESGNSGGALVDQRGNVVGVVVAKLDALKFLAATGDLPQNVSFAIKAEQLALFLESIPGLGPLPPPVSGEAPAGEILFERVNQATVFLEGY